MSWQSILRLQLSASHWLIVRILGSDWSDADHMTWILCSHWLLTLAAFSPAAGDIQVSLAWPARAARCCCWSCALIGQLCVSWPGYWTLIGQLIVTDTRGCPSSWNMSQIFTKHINYRPTLFMLSSEVELQVVIIDYLIETLYLVFWTLCWQVPQS